MGAAHKLEDNRNQWAIDGLGPRQKKAFIRAARQFAGLRTTWRELHGVRGGEESSHTVCSMFTPCGEGGEEWARRVSDAEAELIRRFPLVTGKNHRDVIKAIEAKGAELAADLPVVDKRRTPEEDRANHERMNASIRDAARQQAERLAPWESAIANRPKWAKSLIVAIHGVDECDSMTDYSNCRHDKGAALMWIRGAAATEGQLQEAAARFEPTREGLPTQRHGHPLYAGGRDRLHLGPGSCFATGWRVFSVQAKDVIGMCGTYTMEADTTADTSAPATTGAPAPGNAAYTVQSVYHSKREATVWLAVPVERMGDDEFRSERDRAKSFGGWYSRKWGTTPGGFMFETESACRSFAGDGEAPEPGNDRQAGARDRKPTAAGTGNPKTAEKLREMADGLQGEIDSRLAPMRQNWTPKRGREDLKSKHLAHDLQRAQNAMRTLADAHDDGTIPADLAGVKAKAPIVRAVTTSADHSGGYYEHRETDKPSDASPAAVRLREFVASRQTAAHVDQVAEARANSERARLMNDIKATPIPGFFPTPEPVGRLMIEAAQIGHGLNVLEPSAGIGSLARLCPNPERVHCVEINRKLCEVLDGDGFATTCADFLQMDTLNPFHRIVMNPPFEKQADIDHVRRAWGMLADGGRLVALMASTTRTRDNSKAADFRAWVEENGGEWCDVPAGSFDTPDAFRKTGVNVCMLILDKPKREPRNEYTRFALEIDLCDGLQTASEIAGALEEIAASLRNEHGDKRLWPVNSGRIGSPSGEVIGRYGVERPD